MFPSLREEAMKAAPAWWVVYGCAPCIEGFTFAPAWMIPKREEQHDISELVKVMGSEPSGALRLVMQSLCTTEEAWELRDLAASMGWTFTQADALAAMILEWPDVSSMFPWLRSSGWGIKDTEKATIFYRRACFDPDGNEIDPKGEQAAAFRKLAESPSLAFGLVDGPQWLR